ncbi:hypothetical protein ACFLTO_03620 [Chloroflexota bacterium]
MLVGVEDEKENYIASSELFNRDSSVTGIYGNETQMDASELELGNSPIFVEMTTGMND